MQPDERGTWRPAGFKLHSLVALRLYPQKQRLLAAELQLGQPLIVHAAATCYARQAQGAFLRFAVPERNHSGIVQMLADLTYPGSSSRGWPTPGPVPWLEQGGPVDLKLALCRVVVRADGSGPARVTTLVAYPEARLCPSCFAVHEGESSQCLMCHKPLSRSAWWKLGWGKPR